jgi:chromosome partitioning protein
MHNTVTVMNAKGGVGKSTLVLALAETLATYHHKKILVIDADAQASVSHLLMRLPELETVQSQGRTIVDFLVAVVLKGAAASWREFVTTGVSDVDDARSIDLIASDTQLTLFEREVSKGEHEAQLRKTIGACLAEAGQIYDLVLIDSAPGLSVLTECFLREAAYYLSPAKPDYISMRGLAFLREFRQRDPHMGFAGNLGVIINMKDPHSPSDERFERSLRQDADYRCFQQAILRASPLQATGLVSAQPRSYWAKFPGETGEHLRQLTLELLSRLGEAGSLAPEASSAALPERGRWRAEGKLKAMWSALKEQR